MKASSPRGRFWLVTTATVLMVTLTFSLGQWQLRRAAQKEGLQASLEQQTTLPPLGNPDLAALDAAGVATLADRRASVSGQWRGAQTVYLDNRPMNGRPGFWVLTPLQLSGTDKLVLVQRGWIARNFQDRSLLAAMETPTGNVSLQGRMATGPAKLYAFKGADKGAIRQNLDIGAFVAETGLPLVPALLLETGPASEGLQRDWAAPNTGVDKHYGYAVQWFGLCALVLGLYLWFQWLLPRHRLRLAHPEA